MKLDRIDKKLLKLGYEKITDNKYGITYNKHEKEADYIHVVSILYKANGNTILQSYDPDLFDDKKIGNTCVGLTQIEMKLFAKKIKKCHRLKGMI